MVKMQLNKEIPEAECLFKFAEGRIRLKLGIIMLFTGETGRGKSYAGLRFLEKWYERMFGEKFPISHICENLSQAIMIVKNFKRKGEGILIEELSVLASARDSLTTQNKIWNKFLDTCRIKQAVIIGNCPHISFIDKHFQMMCQVWVNCEGVDFEKEVVRTHPLWLQTSPHKSEPYRHKFLTEEGSEIDYCMFKKPSDELCELYDKIKEESQEDLYNELSFRILNDRLIKMKEFGQKVLPKRELEAYLLFLQAYSPDEAAEKMELKDKNNYKMYLKRAKDKLKDPKYSNFLKELGKMKKNEEKSNKNDKEQGIT